MHEHAEKSCEHELKHCAHCDVVFCEKCKREWKQRASNLFDEFQKGIQSGPYPTQRKPTPYGDPPWVKSDIIFLGQQNGCPGCGKIPCDRSSTGCQPPNQLGTFTAGCAHS